MNETEPIHTKRQIVRVAGKLKEIVTIKDAHGNILQKIISPLMVEFYARDVLQVIIGASLLAIPIAFTEEIWKLGETLPLGNVMSVSLLSLVFIASFVYYNFYRKNISDHKLEFLKRVVSIYLLSLCVVALILTLIEKAPWHSDVFVAIKRVILVSFPASMSAAVADMIK